MNDISYEILDLFKKYGSDETAIQAILENDNRPEVPLRAFWQSAAAM